MKVGLFWIEGFKEDKVEQLLKIPDNGFGGFESYPTHNACIYEMKLKEKVSTLLI